MVWWLFRNSVKQRMTGVVSITAEFAICLCVTWIRHYCYMLLHWWCPCHGTPTAINRSDIMIYIICNELCKLWCLHLFTDIITGHMWSTNSRLTVLITLSLVTITDCLNRNSSSYETQSPRRALSIISSDEPQTLAMDTVTDKGTGSTAVWGRAACTIHWDKAFTFTLDDTSSFRNTTNRCGAHLPVPLSDRLSDTFSADG